MACACRRSIPSAAYAATRRGCWIACAAPAGGVLLQGVSFEAAVSALGAHVPRAHRVWARWISARRAGDPKRYGFCDVLVIGGGPSGLAAALAAARPDAQVALVDESLRTHRQRRAHGPGAGGAGFARHHPVFRDRRRRLLRRPLGRAGRAGAHDQDARRSRGVCHRGDRAAGGVSQQRSAGCDVGVRRGSSARALWCRSRPPGAHRRRQSGGLYALPRTQRAGRCGGGHRRSAPPDGERRGGVGLPRARHPDAERERSL